MTPGRKNHSAGKLKTLSNSSHELKFVVFCALVLCASPFRLPPTAHCNHNLLGSYCAVLTTPLEVPGEKKVIVLSSPSSCWPQVRDRLPPQPPPNLTFKFVHFPI